MVETFGAIEGVFALLDDAPRRTAWMALLMALAYDDHAAQSTSGDATGTHGLVRGRATRLLVDAQLLSADELADSAHRALSAATPPLTAGAWVAGLVRGSGMLLVHQERVLLALDRWLAALDDEAFTHVLALLRRAFADFDPSIRRRLAEALAQLGSASRARPRGAADFRTLPMDQARVAHVVPVFRTLLGLAPSDTPSGTSSPPAPPEVPDV